MQKETIYYATIILYYVLKVGILSLPLLYLYFYGISTNTTVILSLQQLLCSHNNYCHNVTTTTVILSLQLLSYCHYNCCHTVTTTAVIQLLQLVSYCHYNYCHTLTTTTVILSLLLLSYSHYYYCHSVTTTTVILSFLRNKINKIRTPLTDRTGLNNCQLQI